ncbi:MAG TPA: PorV/PorQ family protein [bacterium]|nr:PorV/PorQ family protein [bacterium]
MVLRLFRSVGRRGAGSGALLLGLCLAAPAARVEALSSGADFLSVQVPARPAALAGAFVAYHDDPNAFLWDPAALGALTEPLLGATQFSSIGDTNFDEAAFAQPLRIWDADAGLGLAVQYDSTSNFDQIDANGNNLGAVENYDLLMDLAGGLALTPTLRLGVGGKLFSSRLQEFQSHGLAVDVGGQSDMGSKVTLGVSFNNLGLQQSYDQVSDPLPAVLEMGARVQVVDTPMIQVNGAAELDRPWAGDNPITLGLGLEYSVMRAVVFRAGWRLGQDLGALSLGLGFRWRGMTLDYAYDNLGDLGLTNRFSLGVELGTLFKRWGLTVDPIQGQRPPADPTNHVQAPEPKP